MHGHDFFVLAQQENAVWDGNISTLNMDNPARRDTATLPALGYLVLAFESDNPGAWLVSSTTEYFTKICAKAIFQMHCHIPFHISGGLGVQFIERKDEILRSNGNLGAMQQGCADWQKYHAEHWPNGILIGGDSGL